MWMQVNKELLTGQTEETMMMMMFCCNKMQ